MGAARIAARIAALQGIFITQKLPDGAIGVKVF